MVALHHQERPHDVVDEVRRRAIVLVLGVGRILRVAELLVDVLGARGQLDDSASPLEASLINPTAMLRVQRGVS